MTQSLLHRAYGEVGDSETASATLVTVNRFDSSHLFGWLCVVKNVYSQAGTPAPREQRNSGQQTLLEAPVIDGVVINMPDCPYQGAQQAAWQCGFTAGSKHEDCEPGPVFEKDDHLRSAWVQGYVLAYRGNGAASGIRRQASVNGNDEQPQEGGNDADSN